MTQLPSTPQFVPFGRNFGGSNPELLQLLLSFGLLDDAQNRDFQARQSNESRYNDILELLGISRNKVLGDVEKFGESRRQQINRGFDTSLNNSLADLAQRGLSGTTIRGSLESGNQERRQQALTSLEDSLLGNRIAQERGTLGDITGVMERRTDAYPDTRGLTGALGQLSRYAAGSGGGASVRQTSRPAGSPAAIHGNQIQPILPGQGGSPNQPEQPTSLFDNLFQQALQPRVGLSFAGDFRHPNADAKLRRPPVSRPYNEIQSSGSSGQYQSRGGVGGGQNRPILPPQIGGQLAELGMGQIGSTLGSLADLSQFAAGRAGPIPRATPRRPQRPNRAARRPAQSNNPLSLLGQLIGQGTNIGTDLGRLMASLY